MLGIARRLGLSRERGLPMMLRGKVVACALSVVLPMSLCPSFALAAPFAGGSTDEAVRGSRALVANTSGANTLGANALSAAALGAKLSTQGATALGAKLSTQGTSVWVVSSITQTSSSDGTTSTTTKDYTYNSKGLVIKARSEYQSENTSSGTSYSNVTKRTMGYSGINMTKLVSKYFPPSSSSASSTTVYHVKSEGGYPVRVVSKYGSGKDSSKTVYKYTRVSSGDVKSYTQCNYAYLNNDGTYSKSLDERSKSTYSFSKFKKGHPTKMTSKHASYDGSSSISAPMSYKYDSKGNMTQSKANTYLPIVYSYTYKNGLVASRTQGKDGSSAPQYFTWEKISVPASAVKTVKAQQWAIVNNNANYAFGPAGI